MSTVKLLLTLVAVPVKSPTKAFAVIVPLALILREAVICEALKSPSTVSLLRPASTPPTVTNLLPSVILTVVRLPSSATSPKLRSPAFEPDIISEPCAEYVPVLSNVLPSKVRLASAFIASVPVAVTILLLDPFAIKSETSTAIAFAETSIPVPAPTAKADPPPPVSPLPATAAFSWSTFTPAAFIDIVLSADPLNSVPLFNASDELSTLKVPVVESELIPVIPDPSPTKEPDIVDPLTIFPVIVDSISKSPLAVILPVIFNTEPSNVAFASAFIASVPVAVTILLLEPFAIKSETSTAIAFAETSIPVPAPTARVLVAAIVPPPVKPSPAVIVTPL